MIAVGFAILVWIIRGIARGLKSISRPATPPLPPQAPPMSQNPFQAQTPFQGQNPFQAQAPPFSPFPGQAPPPSGLRPVQTPPAPLAPAQQQAARREQARTQPRQPSAGGPAVPVETNRQDFVRQEQDMFASEPAGLGVSLTSPASAPSAAPNALFGGTDDLVRAIILQEVLGPPLSRRKRPSPPSA